MTIQTPDRLLLEGEEHYIHGISLKECSWPQVLAQISSVRRISACWRGYRCTWSIQDSKLVLTDLTIFGSRQTLEFHEVFPGCLDGVPADWFSGLIEVPQGENLDLGHDFYMHEEQLLLSFTRGTLVKREIRDDRPAARKRALEIEKLYSRPIRVPEPVTDDEEDEEGPKSEIEAECDEFMMAALMGGIDDDAKERWRRFYKSVKDTAAAEDKLLLEVVSKAIDRREETE